MTTYDLTRYEVAVQSGDTFKSLGVVYPKSRHAMVKLFGKLGKGPQRDELAQLFDHVGGTWNGKHQRWESKAGWIGFSGRTERDRDYGAPVA